MAFVPSIYEKRHEFYLNFANAFFVKEFWGKVLNDDDAACGMLCAFYTFDMAIDTDDLHLSIPLVCLILSIAVGILFRQIVMHLHAKLHDQSEIFVKGLSEIQLSGSENPMRRSE